MLFICTKIKNVAVALLVLLVFETMSKKNKKSSHVNNLVVITPLEHEKSYKPLHANNLVVITPLEHEKIFAQKKNWRENNLALKKIQIFLLNTKKFLRPLRRKSRFFTH